MAKERTMSPEEKAKRSEAARLRMIPIRKARSVLLGFIAEGLRTSGNQYSHDEYRLLVQEAAKLQVSMKLGPHGNVEVKDRKSGETRIEFKAISWSKLGIDEQGDLIRSLKAGKVLTFSNDPENPDQLDVEVEDDDAEEAA